MTTAPAPEGLQILREKARFRLTAISRVQWWRLEKMDRVPKRIQLGDNSVGWLRHEIESWIKAKAAGR
ncbi:MAG: AlpA family transcriptional regulator [Nitrospira sp.]|nr:AlpA family transcriptional regulator [Nitrospira sp.]